jgi:hypothetical protein
LNPAGEPLTVTGAGFQNSLPLGVYVAFGPDPATLPADWFTNPAYFQAAALVWQNGAGTATSKKMNANGSFHFDLTRADGSGITKTYTNGLGQTVDCGVVRCGVLTFKSMGSTDRSFDTFRPVSFA